MEDLNKTSSKFEKSSESSGSYRLRKGNPKEDCEIRKWGFFRWSCYYCWLQVITPQGKEGWVHGGYVEIMN